ncbi:unnamed protein product [Mycena citricolor]|uniref:GATA-type domain-containing protein n=1 Tax=Mycena citricolor TaxID=2018698 RepID=A0AAD2GUL8_9AGAR|nr:unnamed protein product [Mycena citricolor]CAK5262427.1 unnamed protein product [Mycena citricolor]
MPRSEYSSQSGYVYAPPPPPQQSHTDPRYDAAPTGSAHSHVSHSYHSQYARYVPYPVSLSGPTAAAAAIPAAQVMLTDDAATRVTDRVRRRCFNCTTTETSTWRRSNLSPGKVLCNKCGLFERTHARPRPEQFPHRRGSLAASSLVKQSPPRPTLPLPAPATSVSAPAPAPSAAVSTPPARASAAPSPRMPPVESLSASRPASRQDYQASRPQSRGDDPQQ